MAKATDDTEKDDKVTDQKSKDQGTVTFDQADHPLLNKDTFKNRRNMAWVSLISIIVFTLLVLFRISPDKISAYDAILGWVYGTFSAVILGYMGATTMGYMSFLKKDKDG